MDHPIYGTFGSWLILVSLVGAAAAVCVGLYSLVKLAVRWREPDRRRHAVRLGVAVAAVVGFLALPNVYFQAWIAPRMGELVDRSPVGRATLAEVEAEQAMLEARGTRVRVGDRVPAFTVTTADGDRFALEDAAGEVVLVNFFATWCGPCLNELPHLQRLWEERGGGGGFRMLVVGREETPESVRAFREEHGFTFPIAADPDAAVYSLFAEEGIPRTFLVGPDGTVIFAQTGFRDGYQDALHAALDAALAAAPTAGGSR